jgi:predicted SprT family Zn-dependent metalloprotease
MLSHSPNPTDTDIGLDRPGDIRIIMVAAARRPADTNRGTAVDTNIIPPVAHRLLEEFGLTKQGWKFKWDYAKRRAGRCSYHKKLISLSIYYVRLNIDSNLDDVIDTILHEIAHALIGPGMHHGPEWQEMACRVGARPVACYDVATVKMPEGQWVAECKGCGKTFRRHRPLKYNYVQWCRGCGGITGRLIYHKAGTIETTKPSTGSILPPTKLGGTPCQ